MITSKVINKKNLRIILLGINMNIDIKYVIEIDGKATGAFATFDGAKTSAGAHLSKKSNLNIIIKTENSLVPVTIWKWDLKSKWIPQH